MRCLCRHQLSHPDVHRSVSVGTGQRAAILCGREGNRRFAIVHRLGGVLNGLGETNDHRAVCVGARHPVTYMRFDLHVSHG